MDIKKRSFRNSEEVSQLNFSKLALPEYFVYKAPTSQQSHSTRAVTLPDVLNFSNKLPMTVKGPRPLMKSIANQSETPNKGEPKSDTSRNFTPVRRVQKIKHISTDQQRMSLGEKNDTREKKIAFWGNIATLKTVLAKYNGKQEEMPMTSKSDLHKVFRFLKHFEELDQNLEGVMDLIIRVVENAITANQKVIENYFPQELQESNLEISKLVNAFQQKSFPYSALCTEMAKIIAQKNFEVSNKDSEYSSLMKDLESKIESQKKSLDDFQVILSQTVPIQLYDETRLQIEAIKQEYQYLMDQNENLQFRNQELGDECQYLKQQYEQEQKEVEALQSQINDLKKENGFVQNKADTSKQNVQMIQNRIKGLKDMMDKVIVRLTIIKQEITQLRDQNMKLEDENSKLHVRAAGGFEALTPRPDYRRLQEEKQLDIPIYDEKGKRQMTTTVNIVNELLDKVNSLENKLKEMPKRKELTKLNVTRKESSMSDFSGGEIGTPKIRSAMLKKDQTNLSTLKLSIFTNAKLENNNKFVNDSTPGTPRSDTSKRGGSRASFKRDSLTFSTPDPGKKGDESPSSSSEDLSTATALLNNIGGKYQKSAFSTQKNLAINRKLIESDFGANTLKETKALMKDVVTAKDKLKDIETSLE